LTSAKPDASASAELPPGSLTSASAKSVRNC
jgi:hypothetical protein